MQDKNNLIRFCKLGRVWLGWSQEDLGKKIFLKKLSIVNFENNKIKNPLRIARDVKSIFEKEGISFEEKEDGVIIITILDQEKK
jgi:DNA-binding XRE family transcriptional regulator